MQINKALYNYDNRKKEKEREVGKYHASEIFSICKGYTTTGNFFKQKEINGESSLNMFIGSALEEELAKRLEWNKMDFKQQTRHEIKLDDFSISGKTDFEFPDCIIETKCPKDHTEGIPDKWRPQMCFYNKASGKQVYLGIFNKTGDKIINLYKYTPEDGEWERIVEVIKDFDKRLKKRYANKN